MKIETSIRKVKNYPSGVGRITGRFLRKNEKKFAQWNVDQMMIGIRPDGTYQDEYHPQTIEYYNKERTTKVHSGEKIRLKDTGEFHQSVLRKTKEVFSEMGIRSHDSIIDSITFAGDTQKNGTDLEKEFGPIFGLTEDNLEKFRELLYDAILAGLKKYWT